MNQFSLSQAQIAAAAGAYGTPLYLYDFGKIEQQFSECASYLPDGFSVHYAMKSNSNLFICHHLASLGSSIDISSSGELYVAIKAGFLPDQIVFTGPGKTDKELLAAVEADCGLIVLESVNEARRLNAIAADCDKIQKVLLRINPLHRTHQSCEISQGAAPLEPGQSGDTRSQIQLICQPSSKFGTDHERSGQAIQNICQLSNLAFRGIHVFTESNVLDYKDLLASWKNTLAIANELRAEGHPIEIIDFGGGIGIPYNTTDKPFDVRAFGLQLKHLFEQNPSQYQCLVEIGRYIVGEAGCYITSVLDIKISRGEECVVLDGGIHQLFRISPKMIEASQYMAVLNKQSAQTKTVTLAGKLPTALDILVKNVKVPDNLEIGDRIVIYNCGAYGFNHSLANFILNPSPAEAAYQGGVLSLIRSPGKEEDFLFDRDLELSERLSSSVPLKKVT